MQLPFIHIHTYIFNHLSFAHLTNICINASKNQWKLQESCYTIKILKTQIFTNKVMKDCFASGYH